MGGQARADRVYESEEIIQKARMLESEYVGKIIYLIEQESLSRRAKIALAALVYMGFDQNVVLANNLDIETRILRFEEAINKTKLSFSRPDVMNPAIVYLIENIRQNFRDFVSRSIGMGERRMQGERKIVQGIYNVPPAEQGMHGQPQQRKHGFNILGKIFGGQ
jgi:hypothetical protein